MLAIITITSLLIDYYFSEPKRFHPLVGFGNLAKLIERKLIPAKNNLSNKFKLRLSGAISCLLLVSMPSLFVMLLIEYSIENIFFQITIEVLVLYSVIGARSLEQHALQVKLSLDNKGIENAKKHVSYMVSRDTEQMDKNDICKATIESTLENGSDAIFAPIFWFCIAGAPGAIFYRLTNTLDAMWGYKNSRYCHFGWCAARLDDVLNWLPARLTALAYSLSGDMKAAFNCWKNQAKECDSPNAGPVMSSGAGALNLELGGKAIYHGKEIKKPLIGCGSRPEIKDIQQTIFFIKKALILWVACLIIIDLFIWFT